MRVFLVDAHPVFREGLKHVLNSTQDLRVVGEADTCKSAIDQEKKSCDVLILDGELDSLCFLQEFAAERCKGRPPFVLVLSRHDEDHHAIQMLRAGADGYVNKTTPAWVILEAVRKVARGGKYVSRELAEGMLLNMEQSNRPVRLSQREYQVICLFASGLGMSQIAAHLSLSVKTVSTYRSRLLDKLNLRSNAELMRYAFREGLAS